MARKANPANALPIKSKAAAVNPDEIETIEAPRIFANTKWNARATLAGDTSAVKEGEGGTRGFMGIVCSIARDGQNTACIVRKNPGYIKDSKVPSEREFLLVAGFQRYEAITGIASGKFDTALIDPTQGGLDAAGVMGVHTTRPMVRCVVMSLDEVGARKMNIEENTLRNSLTTPDLCVALLDLEKMKPGISQAELGTAINNSQPYAGKLLSIGKAIRKVKVTINGKEKSMLDHWREHSVKATVSQMKTISELESDEAKAEAFIKACGGTKLPDGKEGKKPARGPDAWIDNTRNALVEVATMLGYLAHLDLIQVDTEELFTRDSVGLIVNPVRTLKKDATDAQKDDFALAAVNAFEAALAEGPPEPEPEPIVEAKEEKSAKGKKVATNGKGVAVSA